MASMLPSQTDVPSGATAAPSHAIKREARRRVGLKLGLATHAMVFVLVNAGLMLAAAFTGGSQGRMTPIWGWGLGLAIHAAVVAARLTGGDVRNGMLRREIERLQRRA